MDSKCEDQPRGIKTLVLDFGTARIGYAYLDPAIQMVIPGKAIPNDRQIKQRILDLVRERKIDQIVLGLPLNLQGVHTPSTQNAISFAQQVLDWTGLPVFMVDERMTTQAGIRKAREMGGTEKQARKVVDALSAAEIAQSYLINPNLGIPVQTIICARGSIG